MNRILLLTMALIISGVTLGSNIRIDVGDFSAGNLNGWESRSFVGQTEYNFQAEDGQKVLIAKSSGSASGIGRKITIDLTKTPIINWSWRVDKGMPALDETMKDGDDYAARLYVVKSGGLILWNTKALNYVWSGSQSKETNWPNAFKPKNAIMVAARGMEDSIGEWKQERRNVRADFKRNFGIDIKSIDAVAIMTDTDNTGLTASATYGDIYFTAE